ncbi:MAG: FHA domain-containing protein [Actinobacteria bacterium]|nr:FHA domain-containing protein [Actinomycetota bacterium]
MRCRSCGAENERTALTCMECGELLDHRLENDRTMALPPVEVEEEVGPFEAIAQREPSLVVTKGPYVGQRFDLTKSEVTLGRDPGSDIFLDDITVSRKHAQILVEGAELLIEDVGSLNGTYVNNERVERRVLAEGDELQVGKYKLVFVPAKR